MSGKASPNTVVSIICSGPYERKYHWPWWGEPPVTGGFRFPHIGPVARKMYLLDDVIMQDRNIYRTDVDDGGTGGQVLCSLCIDLFLHILVLAVRCLVLDSNVCINAFKRAGIFFFMMTSSNANISCVTGPFCGEFTGPGEFPTQRPVTRSFDVFFELRLNKRLSKQPWCWWFETPLWSLWRQCNVYTEAYCTIIGIWA